MSEGIKGITRADVKIWLVNQEEPIEFKNVLVYEDAYYFGVKDEENHLLNLYTHFLIQKVEIGYNADDSSLADEC